MSNHQEESGTTRRDFLRKAAFTLAAGAAVTKVSSMPTTAAGMHRVLGANDRINVGHVGTGVQGMTHVRLVKENSEGGLKNNTNQIAVCDLYGHAKMEAQKHLGLNDSQTYDDYRKFLEVKDIDAVWVATSDNWHSTVAIAAMEAGKHVYCEKPMCKTVEEAFALYDTVKKTGKVFQVGSQGCTDPKYAAVAKIVQSGKIGKVIVGQDSYCRGDNKVGEWNSYRGIDKQASPTATGEWHVNWEMFRKGTKPVEWDPDRFFRWRKYWEYGSGLVGDLFPHRLHPLMIAMAVPTTGMEGFPLRVSSMGGLYVQKINPETGKLDREVPDFINIIVDFKDFSMMAMSSTVTEQGWPPMIRGNKGTIYYNGGDIEVKPENNYTDVVEASKEQAPGDGEHIETHEKNFLDCIRTNGVPNCNIDLAVRVQTMISMGEQSFRQGKMMHFDPKTRTVSDKAPILDETTQVQVARR